ncbi:MAG: preprotein translocase subunit YajC [Treponema sp.]|nr:preprotein translocase subunit YajC [Treponema sp.]
MEFITLYFAVLLALIVVIGVIPSLRRRKQRQRMVAGITLGDTVVTTGGIVADVVALEESTLVLQLNENSTSLVRIMKNAVQGVAKKESKEAQKLTET